MADDFWAGTFAEARDGDRIMREDPNDVYNRRRCVVCGRPWTAWNDLETGRGEGPHPEDTTCARHRPIAPSWVAEALARHELARNEVAATASHLPPTADDAEVARREVAGGVPTREWPENGRPGG